MSPGRHVLHATNAVATLVLLVTGVFVQYPDLRSSWLGGYGREMLDIHRLATAVFVLGTAALVLPGIVAAVRRQRAPYRPLFWRVHVIVTVAVGVAAVVTGLVIGRDAGLSPAVAEPVIDLHVVAGWLLAANVVVHVGLVAWVRARRRRPAPAPGGLACRSYASSR